MLPAISRPFIVTNDAAVISGDVAWVTLDENPVDRAATGTIAATNLFVRSAGDWKLVLHHGSPVGPDQTWTLTTAQHLPGPTLAASPPDVATERR